MTTPREHAQLIAGKAVSLRGQELYTYLVRAVEAAINEHVERTQQENAATVRAALARHSILIRSVREA